MAISKVRAAFSSLALWTRDWIGLPLWRPQVPSIPKILYGGAILGCAVSSQATVNVYLSTSAPASLQDEFISNATAQYNSTLAKSAFFANTYSLTLINKKTQAPPGPPPVIGSCSAVNECQAQGFSSGMEEERRVSLELLKSFNHISSSYTVSSGTTPIFTCIDLNPGPICPPEFLDWVRQISSQAINQAYAIINKRNGTVFTSTGGVVNP